MTPQAHRDDDGDLWRERSFAQFVGAVIAAVVLLALGWLATVTTFVVWG